MRNNKLTASLDKSKKEIAIKGDEPSQRAFFGICCSRRLSLNILFCIMKMDIMMTTIALASQPTFPVADAFTIRLDSAEEGETLLPTLQEIIAEINNPRFSAALPCTTMPYTFDQGVLASNGSALPLCTAPAASVPAGITINNNTVSQEKWQGRTIAEQDKTLGI